MQIYTKTPKTRELKSTWIWELHRPSSKGTKLLFQGTKAIIYQYNVTRERSYTHHVTRMNADVCIMVPSMNADMNVQCYTKVLAYESIWINKSSVNPKSTSNQSSKPCTVLQYPSRKVMAYVWMRLWMYNVTLKSWHTNHVTRMNADMCILVRKNAGVHV